MKYVWFFIVVVLLLLSACAPQATSVPTPIPTNTPLPPTATSTPLPTETPLPPTPTPEPSPTPDPLIFRDDFEGSLAENWVWTNEDPKNWSLTSNPGWLEINVQSGAVAIGTIDNLLWQEAPEGKFQLETKLSFLPQNNFQIAGLLIYESANDFTQFGRGFCDRSRCVRDGLYFDNIIGGKGTDENFTTRAPLIDTLYLRLIRDAQDYSAFFSEDGIDWKLIGIHTNHMGPVFVGLVVGQSVTKYLLPAQFDYFTISSLP